MPTPTAALTLLVKLALTETDPDRAQTWARAARTVAQPLTEAEYERADAPEDRDVSAFEDKFGW